MSKCVNCSKKLDHSKERGVKRIYCSIKCLKRVYYLNNRDKELARITAWRKANIKRVRAYDRARGAVLREENRERYNAYMREYMRVYNKGKKRK